MQCSICQKTVGGRRLASTAGARIEARQGADGMGCGERVSPPHRLVGLGERREFPQRPQMHFSIFWGHRAALAVGKMQQFLPHIFRETESHVRVLTLLYLTCGVDGSVSRHPTLRPAGSAYKATTGLVADAMTALKELATFSSVRLLWVSGYCGIAGNESVDMFAKQTSSSCFTGPEPSVGISVSTICSYISSWAVR